MAAVPLTNRHLLDLERRDLSLIGRGLRQGFQPDAWRSATPAQREHMAQAAHAYIRGGLGLDQRPLRLALDMPDYQLGEFDPHGKVVSLNARLLEDDDPTALLAAVAHENRHAVQQERMEGLQAVPYREQVGEREVDIWKEAGCQYGNRVYVDYLYNALEVDAREAATSLIDEGFWVEHRRILEERVVEMEVDR
jgi:hypothetical protein